MQQIWPERWEDYELLDFGDGQRLESWSGVKLIRPDIQATGAKSKLDVWKDVHAIFRPSGKLSGEWDIKKDIPKNWQVKYTVGSSELKFGLKLTQFKHVGLFPEQASNWDWIIGKLGENAKGKKVLNLFAYTGGASLVAKACGADTTHVDSIKQVVSWSRENMELSGLSDIRWTVEDALKFAQREAKRGKGYDGIIMDPPSFGRGPKGERWKLQDLLPELLKATAAILNPQGWLILNTYSGMNTKELLSLVRQYFPNAELNLEELCLKAITKGVFNASETTLPTGLVLKIEK